MDIDCRLRFALEMLLSSHIAILDVMSDMFDVPPPEEGNHARDVLALAVATLQEADSAGMEKTNPAIYRMIDAYLSPASP